MQSNLQVDMGLDNQQEPQDETLALKGVMPTKTD